MTGLFILKMLLPNFTGKNTKFFTVVISGSGIM